jgi:hypothetical protein
MIDSYLSGTELLARFQALDTFLVAHQYLWHPRPFTQLTLPWENRHPELAHWLRQRSLEEAEAAQQQPERLLAPAPFPTLAHASYELSHLGAFPASDLPAAKPRLNVDVPGRKWQQIEAFGRHLAFTHPVSHWLDWCAGKGHLGRRLLQPGQSLTCLEFDPALVQAGHDLSTHHQLPAEHLRQDVLSSPLPLATQHTPVALHACGDLHVRLLQQASDLGCRQLAIAPCCYNRTQAHAPISDAARASSLRLDLDDLALPLAETVTAGARIRRQRDTSMARRLGFDLWQRRLRGVDAYLPTPSLPVAWLDKSFAQYCQDLAALKGITLTDEAAGTNWPALEAAAQARLAEVRNLERVRNLFRRPLELWLVLDRALYLQERGYEVKLGTFCAPTLTPRNVLLVAEKVCT